MKRFVVIALLAGCIHDELVDCGNGLACPANTACAMLGDTSICVPPEDVQACIDHDGFAACTLSTGEPGACYAASPAPVCLPAGCGNGLLDPGEVCDDANGVVGDGCSVNCTSDETCGNAIVDPVTGEQCDDGDRVGHDGCTSGCRPEGPQWEVIGFGLPDPVAMAGGAYDTVRRRVVVFGGVYQQPNGLPVVHDQTWEWDGVGWTRVETAISPSARFAPAMAYDPVRRKTILFSGGAAGMAVGADTWAWDGGTWTYLPLGQAPPPRLSAAVAWDPERKTVLLFGGTDGKDWKNDMWEWDGAAWKQLSTPQELTGRYGATLVYDYARNVMVLAGGTLMNNTTADTLERRSGQWVKVIASSPELTTGSIVYDGRRVVAFGGDLGGTSTGDTLYFDGMKWQVLLPASAETPPAREGAALVRDPIRGNVVLSGGRKLSQGCSTCTSTYPDVWTWDGTVWKPIAVAAPAGRAFHAAAFDSLRGKLVVFGGSPALSGIVPGSETWELDGGHWALKTSAGTPPLGRTGAAMAFDVAHGESVMFGGQTQTARVAETWLWNGRRWLLAQPSLSPPARESAMLTYDVARQRIVLFGGNAPLPSADTWEWDGATWTKISTAASPPPRYRATMAYDPIRRRVVVSGGEDQLGALDDTWEYDGTSWTRITGLQSPPARASGALVWNAARGALTLFAGATQTFSQLEDTWELTGTVWSQQFTPTRPGFHQGHSLTPMPDGTGVMVYGGLGNSGTGLTEVWRLRWTTPGAYERCALVEDADGDGLAGCADPDCWARCSPLCPPGAQCDPAAPHCGDGVCNTDLEDCRLCPADCDCTPVCGDAFCDPGEQCPGDC